MKNYTYTVFLRHPETKEVQYGNLYFDSDGYVDAHELFKRLNDSAVIKKDLAKGYTLISMQVVDVVDVIDKIELENESEQTR